MENFDRDQFLRDEVALKGPKEKKMQDRLFSDDPKEVEKEKKRQDEILEKEQEKRQRVYSSEKEERKKEYMRQNRRRYKFRNDIERIICLEHWIESLELYCSCGAKDKEEKELEKYKEELSLLLERYDRERIINFIVDDINYMRGTLTRIDSSDYYKQGEKINDRIERFKKKLYSLELLKLGEKKNKNLARRFYREKIKFLKKLFLETKNA